MSVLPSPPLERTQEDRENLVCHRARQCPAHSSSTNSADRGHNEAQNLKARFWEGQGCEELRPWLTGRACGFRMKKTRTRSHASLRARPSRRDPERGLRAADGGQEGGEPPGRGAAGSPRCPLARPPGPRAPSGPVPTAAAP
jgi:hypothetical protein